MAQEVQDRRCPAAVVRGPDGYLRVYYDKLGLKFETYDAGSHPGARVPVTHLISHWSRSNTAYNRGCHEQDFRNVDDR